MRFSIGVYVVDGPDGRPQHLVSVLPSDYVFKAGLPPEGVVGILDVPPGPSERIRPDTFRANRVFRSFLNDVLAEKGPTFPALVAGARELDDGEIGVPDERPSQGGLRDDFGSFLVAGGLIQPGSFRPNPGHAFLTEDGFFQPDADFRAAIETRYAETLQPELRPSWLERVK